MSKISNRIVFNIILIAFSMCTACSLPESKPKVMQQPTALKLGEGFTNPLGYYEASPRFSWQLPHIADMKFQSAYRIQVASTPQNLDQPDLWDSQKITSDRTHWIAYAGRPLNARQKAYWRVRVWGDQGEASAWSQTQSFELGLLNNSDWRGKWIGHPATSLTLKPDQKRLATPQYFRKKFALNQNQKVHSARLYVTAKGVLQASLNGKPISDDVLPPGWTPYAKRIETLTYDVTQLLQAGDNTLTSVIAGGWYAGRVYKLKEQDHVKPARFLAQLEVTYASGETEVVVTDSSWKVSQSGPIRFASHYDGERYDQSKEMPGWQSFDFDDADWSNAIVEPLDDAVKLRPKRHHTVKTTQVMPAKSIVINNGNAVVFDLGQNMVGIPKLSIPVVKGQEVRIRFAEALHKGEFYTENYRSALSTDFYLPASDGFIQYQPTFTFHGFRYVEISGHDNAFPAELSWVEGLVQHSDFQMYDNFHSSHPKLNKLSDNISWGLRGNFLDIPTDCPQRDERLGWTGDAQVFATPSMYKADVYGFWAAWLQSMREEQFANGMIPLYVPFIEWLNFSSAGWGDAATIIPWELYQLTGDKRILSDNFDMMLKWITYHDSQSEHYVSKMGAFTDWLQPYPLREKNKNRGDTDARLIGTAFYARSVELAAKAATTLGKTHEAQQLNQKHQLIANAFRKAFFDDQLRLKTQYETQTSYLLPLAFGLFEDNQINKARQRLIQLIAQADTHLRTGFLGTPLLAQVLQQAGRSDLMYELLLKETYPSWFYSINNGATTTWERWNSYSLQDGFNPEGMNSLNHYAYGTVARWFYEGILGITPTEAGFKRFQIAPQFSKRLNHVAGHYDTPHGRIAVAWQINNSGIDLQITVPPNTVADLQLQAISKELMINGQPSADHQQLEKLMPGEYSIQLNDVNIQ